MRARARRNENPMAYKGDASERGENAKNNAGSRAQLLAWIAQDFEDGEANELANREQIKSNAQVSLQGGGDQQRAYGRAKAHDPSGGAPNLVYSSLDRAREDTTE